MSATVVGALIVALPLLLLSWLALWRRHRPVFWFALALVAVATGYLAATGAAADIAARLAPGIAARPTTPAR